MFDVWQSPIIFDIPQLVFTTSSGNLLQEHTPKLSSCTPSAEIWQSRVHGHNIRSQKHNSKWFIPESVQYFLSWQLDVASWSSSSQSWPVDIIESSNLNQLVWSYIMILKQSTTKSNKQDVAEDPRLHNHRGHQQDEPPEVCNHQAINTSVLVLHRLDDHTTSEGDMSDETVPHGCRYGRCCGCHGDISNRFTWCDHIHANAGNRSRSCRKVDMRQQWGGTTAACICSRESQPCDFHKTQTLSLAKCMLAIITTNSMLC